MYLHTERRKYQSLAWTTALELFIKVHIAVIYDRAVIGG